MRCTEPLPLHVEQVTGSVPGSAQAPWQRPQAT